MTLAPADFSEVRLVGSAHIVPIHGWVASGFEAVRSVFEANFTEDVEVGASFAVIHRGRTLVDLWGGFQDQNETRPWQAETLVCIYSTIKGPSAAAFATLVEDGLVSYESPVARYWPELAAARDGLTVSELLSHRAGVPGLRAKLSIRDLYDRPAMIRRLEQERPFWAPGTRAGYHAVTWGFLVGELAHRVSGMTLAELLRRRIAEPLNADCSIGLPERDWPRTADLIGPNRARRRPGAPAAPPDTGERNGTRPRLHSLVMENPLIRPFADACSPEWRRAELPASNGHASARGLARVYAALSLGGSSNGTRVLSAETVHALSSEVWGRAPDLVLGYPMRRGRGVNLNTRGELGPAEDAFGHTGTGGSLGYADPAAGLGVGYVMNQLSGGTGPGTRVGRLLDALYRCLNA